MKALKQRFSQWYNRRNGRTGVLREGRYKSVIVQDEAKALRHFDEERYRLGGFVVMPNHAHVLVQCLGETRLKGMGYSWKHFTAREINKVLASGKVACESLREMIEAASPRDACTRERSRELLGMHSRRDSRATFSRECRRAVPCAVPPRIALFPPPACRCLLAHAMNPASENSRPRILSAGAFIQRLSTVA